MNGAVTPAGLWTRIGSPRRAVAVVAHPDDEGFGLGAVLSELVDAGTSVAVVCLTHGEASTLGATPDLGTRRDTELRAVAAHRGLPVLEWGVGPGHVSPTVRYRPAVRSTPGP